jgi:hypothetical protein
VRTERMNEAELTLIRKWVPIYGVRETARALSRDPSGVSKHARRMGVAARPIGRQQATSAADAVGVPGSVSASGGAPRCLAGAIP